MDETSWVAQFAKSLDGMSFAAGGLMTAILAMLANRRGDWLWKREKDREVELLMKGHAKEIELKDAMIAKLELSRDKWQTAALQSTGILETTVQTIPVALRTPPPTGG